MKFRTRARLCPVKPEGYRCQKIPGNQPWTNCPYLNWNQTNRKVKLNANWTDNVNNQWAAPVLEGLLEKYKRSYLGKYFPRSDLLQGFI